MLSAIAGTDEECIFARRRDLRSDLADPAITAHHGRVAPACQITPPSPIFEAIYRHSCCILR
jgi:hypothetical protein